MTFLALLLVHLLAVMSPGPDVFLVIRNTLTGSVRAGFLTTLGIVTGNAMMIALLMAGVSYLLTPGSTAATVVQVAGALYLVYIGVMSLGAKPVAVGTEIPEEERGPGVSGSKAFTSGLLTNLSNAKAIIYWMSIGTQFLLADGISGWMRVACIAVLLLVTGAWFGALSWLIGVEAVSRRLMTRQHWLERAMGAVLVTYGASVFWAVL